MNTITTAANQYANRPADERFPSVAALVESADHQRQYSAEKNFNLRDLRAVSTDGQDLQLENRATGNRANFTHWAFGQFCRMIGAPVSYLRTIPANLAADCVNFGISDAPVGSTASLLMQAPNGSPVPIVRAATSDSYSRVWDSQLYDSIQKTIVDRDDRWTLPPTWSGESAGAYRGDRDSFLILTNGGSIVNDPSAVGKGSERGGLYRGIMVRNSEVGASSVVIDTILYRYVCGNHMLWGAVTDTQFRRRHVGAKLLRDVIREINTLAFNFAHSSAERDEQIIRNLIDHDLAGTKDAVVDELRKIGATKDQAIAAYESCEREEDRLSPRSFWGLAQGFTRESQKTAYQDGRFELDQLAAKLLAKGRKVTA